MNPIEIRCPECDFQAPGHARTCRYYQPRDPGYDRKTAEDIHRVARLWSIASAFFGALAALWFAAWGLGVEHSESVAFLAGVGFTAGLAFLIFGLATKR
jgi:hypothetical protein